MQALTDYVFDHFTYGLYRCRIPEIVWRFVSVFLYLSMSVVLRIKIHMNYYYWLYHHRLCGHTTVGVAGSSPASSMIVGPRISIIV
jgi:hypothetical protein